MGLSWLWVIKTNCDEISKSLWSHLFQFRVLDEDKFEKHKTKNMGQLLN